MAVLDLPGLPSEIYIDIKYHMATIFLILYQNMLPMLRYFKGYADLLHIFCIGILPQSVTIIFFKRYDLFNIFGNLDSNLVVTFPKSYFQYINYAVSLIKSIQYPPQKGWFILPAKTCYILLHLNKV